MKTLLEEWRPAHRGDGTYEVSNLGNVRRKAFTTWDGRKRKAKPCAQALTLSTRDGGYPRVVIVEAGKRVYASVHTLVAGAFLGPANGLDVNHIDGDKRNNRLSNLEYVTRRENLQHASNLGLLPRGTERPNAKLWPSAVREIRALRCRDATLQEIANRFGVSTGTVKNVLMGKTWRHVT